MIIFRHKYIDFKKLEAHKHIASEDLWSLIIDSSKRKILVWKRKISPWMEIKRDVPKCWGRFAEFQQKPLILPSTFLIVDDLKN